MQIEDGFRRHLASYQIDGFLLDDIMVSALEAQPSPSNDCDFQRWLPADKTANLRPRLCVGRQGRSGRVHLLAGLSLNRIPSGKSGPTGMNCSSMGFSFERGRLSMRARASATSLQFSMKMAPRPSARVNHC